MILKAKHHSFIYPFFKQYTLWKMKRSFSTVEIIGKINDKDLPVLLISNHISWWDGFWAMYLNLKLFKRKFHFMMLEDQLRKYWFFNYSGGYSVNKKTRTIIETIDYTAELLGNKENMVLIFPQGEIQSLHRQEFIFEKGVESILKRVENKIQIIFVANLIDYFSTPKPGIYHYIKEYSGENYHLTQIEVQYNQFYRECLESQNTRTK